MLCKSSFFVLYAPNIFPFHPLQTRYFPSIPLISFAIPLPPFWGVRASVSPFSYLSGCALAACGRSGRGLDTTFCHNIKKYLNNNYSSSGCSGTAFTDRKKGLNAD